MTIMTTTTAVTTSLDPMTQRNLNAWLNGPYGEKTKATIYRLLEDNPEEIINAFYTKLEFGTGGLRGLMGMGSNRINEWTIMTATQGLVNYIKKQPSQRKASVMIGYDSRHHSRYFAEITALVLAENGIVVYLHKELRPTPLISFACRWKQCTAAVIITASHNPPEYNGYKVYWTDGGQVLPPHDKAIQREINAIEAMHQVKKAESINHPLIIEISDEVDRAYLHTLISDQFYPADNLASGNLLKIVYSSLHGTGITLMPRLLTDWNFNNVILVEEQAKPDGDFPTVSSPNPENRETLKLGIEMLNDVNGDILIATDPDADRMGIAVMHQNHVHVLNGNQLACLCLNHVCEALTKRNMLPDNGAFIKTIATTELFQEIALEYCRPCFNVLTGFKYIAGLIHEWEKSPDGYQFIFGGEESYGYLLGTNVRDKDALQSSALVCEIALQAKLQGKTLIDKLFELYAKHGMYVEKLHTINFEDSKESREKIYDGMCRLRASPLKELAGIPVAIFDDYDELVSTDLQTGQQSSLFFPRSNMLLFWLEDGSKIVIRPSGTESKIKIYCGVVNKYTKDLIEAERECECRVEALLRNICEVF